MLTRPDKVKRASLESLWYLLNFVGMASYDIRSPIIVPERTSIVPFKVKVHSIAPAALIPNIPRREDNLQVPSRSATVVVGQR